MTFQSDVRQFQTTGIQGEIAREGPTRVAPWNIDPEEANVNPNTIGFAFTKSQDGDVNNQPGSAVPGGAGVFVGILMQPKEHALSGTTSGTLEPTLDLPDGTIGSFLTMGIIYVELTTDGAVGENIFYDDVTGAIAADPTLTLTGHTIITAARVVLQDIPAPGLAIIELTST